jgi:hypothetical protein
MTDNLLDKLYYYTAKLLRVIDSNTMELEVDLGFGVHYISEVQLTDVIGPSIQDEDSAKRERAFQLKNRITELFLSTERECVIHSNELNRRIAIVDVYLRQSGKYINLGHQLLQEGLVDYLLDDER